MIRLRRFPATALLRPLTAAAGLLPWVLLLAGPGALALKPAFRGLCHQDPARTLHLGTPMVVCSRCAGIYLGLALGAALPAPSWNPRRWRLLLGMAAAAMILDVLTQDLGLHPPLHSLRLATGLALGWSASAFLFDTLRKEGRGRSALGAPQSDHS